MAMTEKDWKHLRTYQTGSYRWHVILVLCGIAFLLAVGTVYAVLASKEAQLANVTLGDVAWDEPLEHCLLGPGRTWPYIRARDALLSAVFSFGGSGLLTIFLFGLLVERARNGRILGELERLTKLVEEKGEGQ